MQNSKNNKLQYTNPKQITNHNDQNANFCNLYFVCNLEFVFCNFLNLTF